MTPKRILVVDLETTGLDPRSDAIVEIAACLLAPKTLTEVGWFHSVVRTDVRMDARAASVHGVSLDDLADAPPLASVIKDFAGFAPNQVILAGHNVSFDVAFLRAAYEQTNHRFEFDYHLLDIWSIAFFILGAEGVSLQSYSLDALCSLFGIKRGQRHRALEDARASAAILRHLYMVERGEAIEVLGQYRLID